MKKVITKVPRFIAGLVFITMMLIASSAFCAEVMNEAFSEDMVSDAKVVGGEFVTLPDGSSGWRATTDTEAVDGAGAPNYIEYNISGINDIKEGTIEFWIQRNREGGVVHDTGLRVAGDRLPETFDTVFELLHPDNSTSFAMYVNWDYGRSANISGLRFSSYGAPQDGLYEVVWGIRLPMEFKPAIGDWVHIALTFGEDPETDNQIYINGKLQKKRPLPTAQSAIENAYFGDILSRSDRLRIGIETGRAVNYPGGLFLMYRSVLSSFVVHDTIVTSYALDRFAFSGRPTGLKAEYVADQVDLTWTAASSTDVIGYNVYRKDAYEGSYVKLNADLVDALTYADADVKDGGSYKYIVNGVDANDAESNGSNVAAITVVSEFYRVTETSKDNDPTNLVGTYKDGNIVISWGAPKGIVPSGYNVYRRVGEGAAKFAKLNAGAVAGTSYTDTNIAGGTVYYYSVTAISASGQEGKYPSEIKVKAADLAISSISIDPARAVRSGEEVTVTVSGTAGQTAAFSVGSFLVNASLNETQPGVYYGTFTVPEGNIDSAGISVMVGNLREVAAQTVTIDNDPPSAIIGLEIRNDWENELNIDWQIAFEADVVKYNVYRSNEEITTNIGMAAYKVIDNKDITELWDGDVTPNLTYYYAVSAVDHAGNVSDISNVASANVLADATLPVIYSITESSAGVTLRESDVLELTVEAEPNGTASVSIGDNIVISLTEDTRLGVYTGSYTVKSSDKVNDYIIAKLVDNSDNASSYANDYKTSIDGSATVDTVPPVIDSVSDNSWSIAGFSGSLVEGDMLSAELIGEAGGVAYFDVGGVATKVRMTESAIEAGKYTGNYTVGGGDYAEDTSVTGYLADAAGNVSSVTATNTFNVDTSVSIEVTPSKNVIPADKRARANVTAKVTDLNGDEVAGHRVKFTLTTTDEYTGIVGSGDYTDFEDTVGGTLRTEWRGETDAFGEVTASYKAGFAAKTAMILAKDLDTGDIGVGYITSYVSANVVITLVEPVSKTRRMKKIGRGAYIVVTATPEKLTADGVSKSRIKAKVTDVRGQPVSGDRIVFSMSGNNGRLRAVDARTDNRGVAEAVYTAGKKIGSVVITALDSTAGISGSTMVVLMSDAPAKVYLSASPTTLPADGRSKAALTVKVSDVNDNPNQGAVVTYDLIKGQGSLDSDINETDRNGEAKNGYRASNAPGTVTIEAKVTSRIPSEEEVSRAEGSVFVGYIYDEFEEGEVIEWLKEVGDEVAKGEVIVRISSEMGEFDISSRETGILHSIKKYGDDEFEVGETLGIIEVQ